MQKMDIDYHQVSETSMARPRFSLIIAFGRLLIKKALKLYFIEIHENYSTGHDGLFIIVPAIITTLINYR
jgi:hypothetical protein